EVAAKLDLSNVADTEEDRDTLLQLLFTFGVEPNIGKEKPTFVYHFPASQASLAQIRFWSMGCCGKPRAARL
ncbi:hypothetical protein ACUODJ_61400, partial [Escherichia sp. HC-CC]